ncbi:helix-turn-helix domain-containing protein [Streptomyces sp. NPDC088762]|uniref:helix-turn-helix domain-containing protein n=1 Tax=Streptomyces sp. NPDC088762 TaxID=3365891 RepID=UPI0038109FFB
MTGHLGFGAMLARLLDHRKLTVQELADRAGLGTVEVRAVLAGKTPSEGLLRCLATALGFHAVDLFILAGLEVPNEMAPLHTAASRWVPYVVMDAVHLPAAGRRELLKLIRALPQEARHSRFVPKRLAPLTGGPGGAVVRMFQYRNLDWMGIAKTLAVVTPTYLSAATYGVIGAGRKELTPHLVTDFAALLGIDADELAALTGIVLSDVPRPPSSEAVDAAALLWEVRRLSATQAQHISELARTMRENSRDGYLINLPGT